MKQHLVSRVLLRRFANYRNGPVCAFDLDAKEETTEKVEHLGQCEDFILVDDDSTEKTWQTVERRLPHAFELLEKREILNHPEALDTIRDCMALHWARSFAVAEMYEQSLPYHANQVAENVLEKFSPESILKAMTGLYIPGSQALQLAYERLCDYFNKDIATTGFKAQIFQDLYNRGREKVSEFALEFSLVSDGESLLADAPAIAWDKGMKRVGPLQGVRWGEEDVNFMALGPKHVVAFAQSYRYRDYTAPNFLGHEIRLPLCPRRCVNVRCRKREKGDEREGGRPETRWCDAHRRPAPRPPSPEGTLEQTKEGRGGHPHAQRRTVR